MIKSGEDRLDQVDQLLAANNQIWLFGAGISVDAGIPLMGALTCRIFDIAETDDDSETGKLIASIRGELHKNAHIEHILSHLVDHGSILDRSSSEKILIGKSEVTAGELREHHLRILGWIADTIRWGYRSEDNGEEPHVGTASDSIVSVNDHQDFISAVFNRGQAGVESRKRAVRFFTTNYDTLLEDALSLEGVPFWDGFTGGAVAYRSYRYGESEPDSGFRANVVKLHGSIDWHLGDDGRVWRVREGDSYPVKSARVLIYPQSTKYLATQRDPFASQFDLFRRALSSRAENVLVICGYSFGDDHINQEIELAIQSPDSNTTLVIFTRTIPEVVTVWLDSSCSNRIYLLTEDGLMVGTEGPYRLMDEDGKRDWWRFSGVTRALKFGMEVCANESV